MGACESCVNNTKTSRGGENISYDKKKKRASGKLRKQRNESFATGPRFGSESYETSTTKSSVQKSDFKLLKVIGRGSYGKVYLVQHHMGEQVYAMKVVKKDTVIKSDQVNGIKVEREILEKFDHPFIMKLQFAFQDHHNLYLIMEFINGGELFFHLKNEGRFKEHRAQFYAAEIVLALEYLHDSGVVYRDVKPENILVDCEGHIRLTDFGLSKGGLKETQGMTESFCGTTEYLAPEIIKDKQYGFSVDWYSFGLVLYEMLSGQNPFKTGRDTAFVDQMNNILHKEIPMMSYFSAEASNLLINLLKKNPAERIGCGKAGAAEIRAHPFFKGIDWEKLLNKEIQPPFVPKTDNNDDTANIDQEFLDEAPRETPAEDSALLNAASTQDLFENFEFVNEDLSIMQNSMIEMNDDSLVAFKEHENRDVRGKTQVHGAGMGMGMPDIETLTLDENGSAGDEDQKPDPSQSGGAKQPAARPSMPSNDTKSTSMFTSEIGNLPQQL